MLSDLPLYLLTGEFLYFKILCREKEINEAKMLFLFGESN